MDVNRLVVQIWGEFTRHQQAHYVNTALHTPDHRMQASLPAILRSSYTDVSTVATFMAC